MQLIQDEDLVGIGAPAIVHSFGRSGTHLVMDMIRCQLADFQSWKLPGERLSRLYVELDGIAYEGEPIRRSLDRLRRAPRPVLKTHFLAHQSGYPRTISTGALPVAERARTRDLRRARSA